MAVVEYARNVCGLPDAHTVEANPNTKSPIISWMPGQSEDLEK
jgi:CTP synthase